MNPLIFERLKRDYFVFTEDGIFQCIDFHFFPDST